MSNIDSSFFEWSMESQITEPITYDSENYAQSFYRHYPTDSRFISVEYHKFEPITNLDASTISFFCPRFESPSVYMIQDLILEARIVILKPDGNVPDTTKQANHL